MSVQQLMEDILMSGIDGSVIEALAQVDPEEAQFLEEELDGEEVERILQEEAVILSYDF